MGYQVGNVCYATKLEAENAYFSLVAPVIVQSSTSSTTSNPRPPISMPTKPTTSTTKVTLVKPEYLNGKWTLQGQVMSLSLPECDPAKNMKEGMEIGWLVFGLLAAMYLFTLLKRLIR